MQLVTPDLAARLTIQRRSTDDAGALPRGHQADFGSGGAVTGEADLLPGRSLGTLDACRRIGRASSGSPSTTSRRSTTSAGGGSFPQFQSIASASAARNRTTSRRSSSTSMGSVLIGSIPRPQDLVSDGVLCAEFRRIDHRCCGRMGDPPDTVVAPREVGAGARARAAEPHQRIAPGASSAALSAGWQSGCTTALSSRHAITAPTPRR